LNEGIQPEAHRGQHARSYLPLFDTNNWLAFRLVGQHAGVLGQLHASRLPAIVDDLLHASGWRRRYQYHRYRRSLVLWITSSA
jgi:hypothetical protein